MVFVDRSLLPLLWPHIDECKTVRAGGGHGRLWRQPGRRPRSPTTPGSLDYEELLAAAASASLRLTSPTRTRPRPCVTPAAPPATPKGVVYSHRSMVLHSMAACLADSLAVSEADVDPSGGAHVPRQRLGAVPGGGDGRGGTGVSRAPIFRPRPSRKLILDEGVTLAAGVPTIWMGARPLLAGQPHQLRAIICGGSAVPESPVGGLPDRGRAADPAGMGHDRDQPAGHRGPGPPGATRRLRRSRRSWRTSAPPGHAGASGRAAHRRSRHRRGAALGRRGDAARCRCAGPGSPGAYYNDERGAASFTADGWLRTGDVAAVSPTAMSAWWTAPRT